MQFSKMSNWLLLFSRQRDRINETERARERWRLGGACRTFLRRTIGKKDREVKRTMKQLFSAKNDSFFWLMIAFLTLGVSLHWPLWARAVVIVLAAMQLVQVIFCVARMLQKRA